MTNSQATSPSPSGPPSGTVKNWKTLGVLFAVGSFLGMVNGPAGIFVDRVTRIKHSGLIAGVLLGGLGALLHQIVLQDSTQTLKETEIMGWKPEGWAKQNLPSGMYDFFFEPDKFANDVRAKWGLDKNSSSQQMIP